nr:isochorismate synthase [Ornithinimicrobium sp. F0845]
MRGGPDRFALAAAWWRDVVAGAEVVDEVGLPGTGLLAFGSFAFSPDSPDGGGLIVPRVIAGQHAGRAWVTSIEDGDAAPAPTGNSSVSADATDGIRLRSGAVAAEDWPAVIAGAVARIEAGEVAKVVLARDVVAEADRPIDTVALLRRLASRYAATWTFAVDGLIGATPEMLVRLQDGRVRSRVLAGTVRRDRSPAPSVTETHPELEESHRPDPRLHLVSDAKELEEHAFAVRSVADALTPHCASLQVPEQPFVLELPDVYHLATDLSGEAADDATSLDLAAALHPSAAVCGTPSEDAARLIAELEGMDRGRYAGPVGWVDADGDGDWGIALRCGQLAPDARSMRLFAGGGIVAASDPEAELAETEVKLAAMRHALGLESGHAPTKK